MSTPVPPSGRVVVFGATGYTGDLAARALVAVGARPVLAGRDVVRLGHLAAELGGPEAPLEVGVADATDPVSVAGLVDRGDVLLTTVGPFSRWGWAALEAVLGAGAHYVDSTGEGGFIRAVFEKYGPRAQASGSVLLTAFGYDFVPGNLAAALALDRVRAAGAEPATVDIGYFVTGRVGARAVSGGTRASVLALVGRPGYAFDGGHLVERRPGSEVVWTTAGGRRRPALAIPASEQFTLPRLAPSLGTIRVGLGWLGGATPLVALASRAAGAVGVALDLVPGARRTAARVTAPLVAPFARGSSGGPDAAQRARTGSLVAADVRDPAGHRLGHVELTGPNPYTLTGDLLAWAARAVADGSARAAGAVGPVEAFGLEQLTAAAATMGLAERRYPGSAWRAT